MTGAAEVWKYPETFSKLLEFVRRNMIWVFLLLAVVHTTAGFNIFTIPVRTFHENDDLFGQTTVQSKKGVMVTSPNLRPPAVFDCTIESMCSKVVISASADKGLRPIVSAAKHLTEDTEQHMFCQQARTKLNMKEDLNGNCAMFIDSSIEPTINPATLVVEQLGRNITTTNSNNNNNNNKNEDNDDEEDPGTEIAFVLDGSSSLTAFDFDKAKEFISTVIKNVWEKCLNCDFAVLHYGTNIKAELLLKDSISNSSKALQTISNIQRGGSKEETFTASAIIHLCEHVFVAENGSREDSKKIMILLSDGAISYWDKHSYLPQALALLQKQNISRYAIGVGNKTSETFADMKKIAPDNNFMVDDYKALDSILSRLEISIINGIEGLKHGAGFTFQLAEAGFSNHMAPDGFLLFGAVGAYDWSGGVILKHLEQDSVTFLNGSSTESRFSYLGYSVISAVDSNGTFYISGAPRYNLTGGVFVFSAKSHKLMSVLQGEQVGSYFGSVLLALDTDKDSETDYLLVGAPHFHRRGEEGKVYVFRLHQGEFLKEDWEWQGLDNYEFSRFGSAIASVGDLDGNRFNDVAVGAPLEEDAESGRSGSIYIYSGIPGGIMHEFTQRISAGDFDIKLRHFGQSISAFSDQEDNHRQKYISVGSQGTVTVLETLPVIGFKPKLTLNPNKIRIQEQRNTVPAYLINLYICFNSEKETIKAGENLTLSYIIHLDAGRNPKRLFFKDAKARESNFTLLPDTECLRSPIELNFKGCYDCFSPIEVRLQFNLHSTTTSKPVRILDALISTEVTEKIEFEKDCKGTCVRHMSLSDSLLSHDKVVIGSDQNVSISVNLTNHEDRIYMTTLLLTYSKILLYNMFKVNSQTPCGSVVCEVQETSQLKCRLLHPVFRRNSQVNFDIVWQLADKQSETQDAYIIANLTCEDGGTHVLDEKKYHFGIKNVLRVQLTGEASPNSLIITDAEETKQLTFTFQLHGKNDHNAALNISISITVKAEDTDFKINHITPKDKCVLENTRVQTVKKYLMHCVMTGMQSIVITAEATIRDVLSVSEKITAEATVRFDEDLYEALEVKYNETVEVAIRKLEIKKSMAAIIGGSIGGFLFLAVIIVLLIKCGFFKRRHGDEVQSITS